MHWTAYFFGGAFLANAIPHWVNGLSGRPFQTPFATPSGIGLSSSTVNVLWGLANLVVAWLLLVRVDGFDLRDPVDAGVFALGALAMSLFAASHFGKLHGDDLKKSG